MSRRALGLVLLALGATASHLPRGGRWVSVRGGAQESAASAASKKKEHKKLFENAERAQAERQTGKLKSGSKIELGARSGGSHFLGFLWASTTKVLRGIARLFGFSVRAATKPKKAEAAKGASGALKAHLESAPAKGSTQRIVKEVRAARAKPPSPLRAFLSPRVAPRARARARALAQLREFVASPPDGCEVSVGKNLKVRVAPPRRGRRIATLMISAPDARAVSRCGL